MEVAKPTKLHVVCMDVWRTMSTAVGEEGEEEEEEEEENKQVAAASAGDRSNFRKQPS